MYWNTGVEAAIAIPLVIMFGLCAFMMLSMFLRGVFGGSGHGGRGMMCMGHGHDDQHSPRDTEQTLLDEPQAERARLDALIDKAEQEASGRAR